ncbi:glutamate synthase subunit beta [Pontibacter harenae]|uniref:glutamate synthase subunit beta n=1 Tax=Pontibacter harenae TaxID=2894083 RepID=UPI001E5B88D8|nr:glutamate synthase subunit beta [Pontibacter harenae]MCC9165581.1 glutamate synthase subunit beta [Pontibacter harenae]
MGKETGFLKFDRSLPPARDPKVRVNDYNEIYEKLGEEHAHEQAARCMDCGVPFCHSGCPLGNKIPDFNDAVYRKDWVGAIEVLSTTNNFPEFTGRICPAPCEASCVLGINKPPVTIEYLEKSIAEKAFELGLIKAQPPQKRTGKKVAVIGSGPAGMAAAAQLNTAGHWVSVFEKNDNLGGLLQYGIPDFKMEKWVIERRIKIMEEEGVSFFTNTNIGVTVSTDELMESFDAVVLCTGAEMPMDLPIEGRDLKGVHFAMDFLVQQNRRVQGLPVEGEEILATGKNVMVIGGGDTGADCVGTSNRQRAKTITQIARMKQPPTERPIDNPWPQWPMVLQNSSSHEEGVNRAWAMLTKAFLGDEDGNLRALLVADLESEITPEGRRHYVEIEGTERELPCELALLAIGFKGPESKGLLQNLGVELDNRGNVVSDMQYRTSVEKVFTAGDAHRGQSLVVWAISEGREAARAVDLYLMGETALPSKNLSVLDLMSM